jgi:hypothetical protein
MFGLNMIGSKNAQGALCALIDPARRFNGGSQRLPAPLAANGKNQLTDAVSQIQTPPQSRRRR